MDVGISSKIILSDEAYFHLDSFVNRQNCRFVWDSENPHVISEKQIHNVSLFGANFGQEASSNHTFLRMRLVKQQVLMLDIISRHNNTVLSAEIE